jgi:TusA-related sulfurtransferase
VTPEPDPDARDLDLRGTPCPLNFIRTRLALEKVPAGGELRVRLDRGEPERMVSEGLRAEGHHVEIRPHDADPAATAVSLRIRRGDG